MFLRGEDIALLGVTRPLSPEALQPAGVDLSVWEVEAIDGRGVLGVSERVVPQGKPLEPTNGWWELGPGHYRVRFREVVSIPRGYVGLCFPRSSLLRMGAALYCAVWDPGYRGRGQALLQVLNPRGLRLERGARVAQLVVASVWGPVRGYTGRYQGEGIEVHLGPEAHPRRRV